MLLKGRDKKMMSKTSNVQTVKNWIAEKFLKDTEIVANWQNGQIILKTNSEDFPYAEIRIRPMTEEVGDELITEVLDKNKSYEEHKRNRFIAKLMRERGEY